MYRHRIGRACRALAKPLLEAIIADAARPRAMRGRVLVVDHATPTPDQDSGSACTFGYLRILAASGFKVTFVSPALAGARRYTQALNDLGVSTPMAAEWPSLNAVIETLGPETDVFLLYRGAVATHIVDIARRVAPAAKIVFHPVDLHFLRMQREAALTGDRHLADAARAMREVELDLVRRADATIVVSHSEYKLLGKLAPEAVVHHIPIIRETPQRPSGILGWRRLCSQLPGSRLGALGPAACALQPSLSRAAGFRVHRGLFASTKCRRRVVVCTRGVATNPSQRLRGSLHRRRLERAK